MMFRVFKPSFKRDIELYQTRKVWYKWVKNRTSVLPLSNGVWQNRRLPVFADQGKYWTLMLFFTH